MVVALHYAPSTSISLGYAMLGIILILVVLLLLIGALPTWPHSRSWGYAPTGGLGLVMLVVLVMVLMGKV